MILNIASALRITKSTSAAVESSTTASKISISSPKPSEPVPTAFKSAATSVKASDIKEGPKKISKRVMTIKTTVKNIWKPVYLQPLYDLVHTTNLLVTHTFAFTKYIYLQELATNENFALNNFVTKDFFVEVFLSLVLSKGGNSTRLKDTTKNYRRLISKYKEAYFEDAGYTPLNLPYAQQIALYECTKIQTAYYNNIKAHFGNRLRSLINKLFKKKEKAEGLRGEMQANKSSKSKTGSKFETWGAVVDLNKKAFEHQGFQKSLRFQGTLETDGIGVSIIKQSTDTSRKSPKPNTEKKVDGNQTEHIEGLDQADLKSTEGKCVLIDPGRRDLMYCMKEISTVEEKQTFIFTKNNRSKCSRHFKYLRKHTQPFVAQKAEAILSRPESNSVNLKMFVQYIKTRASSQLYATYLQIMLQQKHISERLDDSEKSKVLGLAKEMYRRSQKSNYKKTISTELEKLQLLPFRKLKFSSKLFFDQNDQKLVRSLRAKFGQDDVLVFGDWSASNVKYQESTRSKGLIRMLKKNGFVVYLINEYKTSSHCATFENELEKFKTMPNPRPYQRKKKPDVLCNGLLRHKSLSCLKQQTTGIKRRLWNRDQAVVLNFLKILNSLRKTGERPSLFTRKYPLD
ncbi:hypothetical protein G6F43_010972 [Rhizopus delemar]|nr:hypothetical protein G6F43_010972 [Rhizopus delemar]